MDDQRLPSEHTELGSLPVEQFTNLQILVSDFQKADVFQIHHARCTGTKDFRNGDPRKDGIWVQAGGEESYRDLRGRIVGRLLAPFKIRNVRSGAGDVHRLAFVRILDHLSASKFHCGSRHIPFSKRHNGRDMRTVAIGAVIGQVHLIPSRERQWIVNHRIDLRTFNEIYYVILQDCVFGCMSITWLIWALLRIGPHINTRPPEVKTDPPHSYMSTGPHCVSSLIRRTFSLLFLFHTHFFRRTFYPSSGCSALPPDVLPSSA